MDNLSQSVRSLWAKTNDVQYLYEHMHCTAEKARAIWRTWLSDGARTCLSHPFGAIFAESLFVFLAFIHDIGKATPAFQLAPRIPQELTDAVLNAGFPSPCITDPERKNARHELASYAILLRNNVNISVAAIVGGHHGRPPSIQQANDAAGNNFAKVFGFRKSEWKAAQNELLEHALSFAGITRDELCAVRLNIPQQMLLSGLVILADWLASSQGDVVLPERWETHGDWELFGNSVFSEHIGHSLNGMQAAAVEVALGANETGIAIIEAAMGTGKTEAALALAEIFAFNSGRTGVYFALPTRATADGILARFKMWIGKVGGSEPHAITLAHGKARFNKAYRELPRVEISCETEGVNDGVYVHQWLSGRKTQLLADFAVGTIDQLLMSALRHKHLALRHVGFANKVVIIDEVHAYDAYMSSYLCRALRWLGEYNIPVVVLSATLPSNTRQRLIEEYLGKQPALGAKDWATSRAYPLITFAHGDTVEQATVQDDGKAPITVAIERYDGDIGNKLEALLEGGGCAGVVVNTVKRAQDVALALEARFGQDMVLLLHSRYTAADRAKREQVLLEMLGPDSGNKRPQKLIVVGTQVIEQSLDIDFDVMLTDCCPMDLLLQRLGRLFRHKRGRHASLSSPMCFVMNTGAPDDGSLAIYGEYELLCTRFLLPDKIELPGDIPRLVQAAYGGVMPIPEGQQDTFAAAKTEHQERIAKQEAHASKFELAPPTGSKPDLVGWLDYSDSNATDRHGEASVRDGDQALEVILLVRDKGGYRLLPWIGGAERITHEQTPESGIAYALAGCSVALPRALTPHYALDDAIRELDKLRKDKIIPPCWDESHWLSGSLYLPLDEKLEAQLRGVRLKYSQKWGLEIMGKEDE